jgi:hypothetical protein
MQMYKVATLLVVLAPSAFAVQRVFLAGKLDSAKTAEVNKKGYGPSSCVNVEQTETGTCVLRTACDPTIDLEKTEFAFLCVLKDGEVQKHSYGTGGFGSEETFDTSVKCERCLLPTMALSLEKAEVVDEDAGGAPAAAPAAAAPADKAAAPAAPAAPVPSLPIDLHHDHLTGKNQSKREGYLKKVYAVHTNTSSMNTTGKASKYGPDGCISTYVSPKNTCMMKTDCQKQADSLKNYDFGLTCVDDEGKSVRHLFGTNSFDPEETFDTLIDCKMCIGLDVSKMEKKESLAAAVGKLRAEVKELSKGMKDIKADVEKLNGEVFKGKAAPAPAPAPAGNFVLHKVEQKDTEVMEKKNVDSDKTEEEDQDEEEAPAPVASAGNFMVHKVEQKDKEPLGQKEVDSDVKSEEEDEEEEEAPAPDAHKHRKKAHHKKVSNVVHHKPFDQYVHNLAHKKDHKGRHHHKHHKKVASHRHHRRHRDEEDSQEEAASDENTEASEDDSDVAPKPVVDEEAEHTETAEASDEEEADGW